MPNFSAEERQLLADSLDGFLSRHYDFERWKSKRNTRNRELERLDFLKFAEQGWLGIGLPEDLGGVGGGAAELAIVMSAVGRHMVLEDFLGPTLSSLAINWAGSSEQRAMLLPRIADGNLRVAFCHTEPDAGFERTYVKCVASRDGNAFLLNGTKGYTIGAHDADMLLVPARQGPPNGQLCLFLVPSNADGVTITAAPSLDGRMGAMTRLHNTRLSEDSKLTGNQNDISKILEQIWDRGALSVCAEACGAMYAATESTVEYLKVRRQFGQTLSKFQVLQHRLVDMHLSCEEARAMVHVAFDAVDQGAADARQRVWQAKVQTGKSARFVGAQSLQLHGGVGMTDELQIGHLYKRLCVCEALFGDADWYIGQLASLGSYRH